jgi:hypothetical protein
MWILFAAFCQVDPPKSFKVPSHTIGDVTVYVPFAGTGKVRYHYTGGRVRRTEGEHLSILVEIDSKRKDKIIPYKGWASDEPDAEHHAKLTDEHGNSYRRFRPPAYEKFWYQVREISSVHPGKVFRDELVFEVPVDSAKTLILTLPGKALGIDNDFTLNIDVATMARGDLDAVRDVRWFVHDRPRDDAAMKRRAELEQDQADRDALNAAERKLTAEQKAETKGKHDKEKSEAARKKKNIDHSKRPAAKPIINVPPNPPPKKKSVHLPASPMPLGTMTLDSFSSRARFVSSSCRSCTLS